MTWATPYEFAHPPCSGKAQDGTSALAGGLLNYFPGTGSDGIYACRKIGDGQVPSVHSQGRAFDHHIPLLPDGQPNDALGQAVLTKLHDNAVELGIQLVIWNRRIYSEAHPWPGGDTYSVPGGDPHTMHLHIEQRWDKALALNFATVWAILNRQGQHGEGGGQPIEPPEDEDDMPTLQEIRELMAGPPARQIRVQRPDGSFEDEFYAWVGGVLRHVWTRETQNGLQALGALAPEVDICVDGQITQVIQQGRDWGTHVQCGCGRATCRVNVA